MEVLKDWAALARKHPGSQSHVLFTAPAAGLGRRTIARVAANEALVDTVELCAPFDVETLREAHEMLADGDVLFIDDLELACLDQPGASQLAQVLQRSDEGPCVIGSTVRPELLPTSILDMFPVETRIEHYDALTLSVIAARLCAEKGVGADLMTAGDFTVLGALAGESARRVAALVAAVCNRVARLGRRLTEGEVLEVNSRVRA